MSLWFAPRVLDLYLTLYFSQTSFKLIPKRAESGLLTSSMGAVVSTFDIDTSRDKAHFIWQKMGPTNTIFLFYTAFVQLSEFQSITLNLIIKSNPTHLTTKRSKLTSEETHAESWHEKKNCPSHRYRWVCYH
jgi:hypothetical protein